MKFAIALAAPLALAAAAFGHDLYLMPEPWLVRPGQQIRVVYQNGDEFPEGVAPVRPERLRRAELLWKGGAAAFTDITAEEKRTVAMVRAPGEGTLMLISQTIPNFIELDAEKFEQYLRHENLDFVLRWRKENGESSAPGREIYSKYVKSLVRCGKGDGFHAYEAGLTIEFVAEADPYGLRPGQPLPVRLRFRGRPAAGVAIESAWLERGRAKMETIGRTDAEGRIVVPIRAAGPHRLHAIVMERRTDRTQADWESFWATLTFSIPER
ncbi:MAG: DUF4198 domain-containing protein [Bryobacteraceae bacterium]|nr:DUF4198 domain-containing protein [Bryobacteraceae bacterium]